MERSKQFFEECQATFMTIARLILKVKWRKTFRNTGEEKLLLLGNGPSLSNSMNQLGDSLGRIKTMCVNLFPTTPDFKRVKPSYFVVSAPEFWLENVDPVYLESRSSILRALRDDTSWPLEVFIPWEARRFKEWVQLPSKNPNITVTWYNIHPAEGFRWFRHWAFRMQLGMPRPHNVLIPSMMVAIAKGIREVYVVGADHSWLPQITVDEQNVVLVNQKHFYDSETSRPEIMRKLGTGRRTLAEVLQKFQYTFASYFLIRHYAESRGVRILNATPGSFIDAFDRISTEELRERTAPH
ncbi:MAG TPA: hypothetical protein PK637_04670 [Flavobacteriales bacterium]|nr:hypothetical protein [Flavobacteriales bacterium]HRE96036.1 hypothetical protein [Flavobacteriales bacterium]HRJ39620.1 hypothetical protein [Flavobacteriales bacterium]